MLFFTDVNECISGPCQNGGVCQDFVGSFICSCLAGWTGQFCQTGRPKYQVTYSNKNNPHV